MSEEAEIFYPPIGTGSIELQLASADTGGNLSMFIQTLPPGEGTNEHLHRDCDETGYVLEGTIRTSLGGKITECGPGDSFFVPRKTPHAISNGGAIAARFLFTVTPGGLENYFREVSTRDAGAPEEIDRIRAIAKTHGLEVVGPPLEL